MKKIININFQGRVIPIEEAAYDTLKQYVESLRRYFANEEGRDEIINDIESRIAELFSERLKRGSACITEDDVNAVIASIGRPQDFEEQDGDNTAHTSSAGNNANDSQQQYKQQQQYNYAPGSGRLYRNADDKILAGVCSGLANSLRIDPAIMRVLFVLFIGITFWIYIVLWIVVPVQSLKTNITKRLYRNPEHRVIGGVASGLAAYFKIEVWIPRLVFALPLLLSIVNGAFRGPFFNFHFFPGFLTGSLVGTLILVYIILWIVLPEATTASEKLEMRGEKIDLNSIRDTVKEDLGGIKERAEKFGAEVKETAQQFGERAKEFSQTAGQRAQSFAAEAAPVARRTGSGLGHAIGVLFKIFFFFIAGCIVLSLLAVLVSLFGVGVAMMPFKSYLLDGNWQSILAWSTLLLFLGVPIVAFIVWIIRRIVGAKSKNHYLGYTFGVLWLIGLFCFINLGIAIKRNFDYRAKVQEDYTLAQPNGKRITVKVANSTTRYYGSWWGPNWGGFFNFTDDSLLVKNIGVKIEKSKDSAYHVFATKSSNGSSGSQAESFAKSVGFHLEMEDSTLILDNGFSLPRGQKFRNQMVVVTVQVPVNRRILIDHSVSRRLNRFNIHFNPNEDWSFDDDWDHYQWEDDVEYIMTSTGLERADGKRTTDNFENNDENGDQNDKVDNKYHYRYKQIEDSLKVKDSLKEKAKNKLREEIKVKDSLDREKKVKEAIKSNTSNKQPNSDVATEEPMYDNRSLSPFMIFSKIF